MSEKNLNILILEDRKAEAEFTKRAVLKHFPTAVFTVADNKESFLDRINWSPYDVVLGDYHLPGYSGLEAMFHVRQKYPEIPFIFVTGTLNNEEKVAHAILHGANGYVLKENIQSLAGVIEEVLKKTEQDAALAAQERKERLKFKIKLQRATAVMAETPDFSEKKFVEEVLSEMTDFL